MKTFKEYFNETAVAAVIASTMKPNKGSSNKSFIGDEEHFANLKKLPTHVMKGFIAKHAENKNGTVRQASQDMTDELKRRGEFDARYESVELDEDEKQKNTTSRYIDHPKKVGVKVLNPDYVAPKKTEYEDHPTKVGVKVKKED